MINVNNSLISNESILTKMTEFNRRLWMNLAALMPAYANAKERTRAMTELKTAIEI